MPRRIRVNGFIARRFMFPQKGSLSGSRRALAEKRGPVHSRTNDSQHLEGDFPPRRGEIAIELDGLFASEMNVERRSILAHVIGPGGLRDGQNVRLLQHPRERDLRRGGVPCPRDPRGVWVFEQPALIDWRVRHGGNLAFSR